MSKKSSTERRRQIVDAATAAFTTGGYDGTTIGNLAGELGISKAAIAYYFPTKDDFLPELVTPLLDLLDEAIVDDDSLTWPDDAVRACGAYLDAIAGDAAIARWIDTDQVLQADPRIGGRLDAINTRLCDIITGGSRRRSDRIRATAVLGGLWRPVREFSRQDIVEHRDEIIVAALSSYRPITLLR